VNSVQDITRVFAAAANPQRLSIMELLAEQKKVVYSDIMRKLKLTSGNLGFHLKELMDSELVEKKNSDSYSLTDLGLRLMAWAGKVESREERLLKARDYERYMNMRHPLRKYRQHPGNSVEWLGGFIVIIGIGSIILGADLPVIGILIAAGCATALGGAILNHLAGVQALKAHQEEIKNSRDRRP